MSRYETKRGSPEWRAKIAAGRKGQFTGASNPRWNGGKVVISGYRYVHSPDHPFATKLGYVAEHRLVVEALIDRPVRPGEAVHHINGDTLDNRPENLELCASNGRHTIAHHAVRDTAGRFSCA